MLNRNRYYYPAVLDLQNKKCVIIGGGLVALRKLKTLIEVEAKITVVAPHFCDELLDIARKHKCDIIKDFYHRKYLEHAFLVIAATDSRNVNAEISQAAPCLCNNITQPELSNFVVPASFKEGDITIALTTNGMPAFTRLLKDYFQELITPDLVDFNTFLLQQRSIVKTIPSTPKERTLFWRKLLQKDLLNLVMVGNTTIAKEKILNAISSFRTKSQNSAR